ncbi:FecR domain-containing protein [Planctomicrobium sp. SH664]|uniref:FecR domain-containing protein n=1 Tax=Planctomicrobium sp. SH664 TaxID=3448125 RepID=UPI003F5B5EBB
MTATPREDFFGQLPEDQELRELVAAHCHGVATSEQRQALHARLAVDEFAREFYLAHVSLHAELFLRAATFPESLSRTLPSDTSPVAANPRRSRSRRLARSLLVVGALAILPLIACLLQPGKVVAWQLSPEPGGPRMPLRAGALVQPVSQSTTIEFPSGVQVGLLADSSLQILSEDRVRLNAGQIHADVGDRGRGFTVLTATAEVVDLGTTFGVAVSRTLDTDVVVFSGEVAVETGRTRKSSLPRLLQGEAIRVDAKGGNSRISEIWEGTSPEKWSTRKMALVRSPIVSVEDNRPPRTSTKYYAIVPGGFREDAKVYVDRPYEWNSLTKEGLPPELQGADYIRTFNEDKFLPDFQLTLTLSSPAEVYLLVDPRHLTPEWLLRDFELKDWKVGLDLGRKLGQPGLPAPPPGISADRMLGKGAGESVDIPMAVWKRKTTGAGRVLLGANGARSEELLQAEVDAGSMYGIVVRPIDY